MPEVFNIYCDESCHLEHDRMPVMVLGAVWCPAKAVRRISRCLREIKERHGLPPGVEAKWIKVSKAKQQMYLDLVDYFFTESDLHFRGVLIPDKGLLNHAEFDQTHDTWYYKMCFRMLEPIIDPAQQYRVYLDIKDTRGEMKRKKLKEILRTARLDSDGQVIEQVQQIRSHECPVMQLTDILVGAVGYHNRHLVTNESKCAVVRRIQERSGKTLEHTTWLRESKFNMLRWQGQGAADA